MSNQRLRVGASGPVYVNETRSAQQMLSGGIYVFENAMKIPFSPMLFLMLFYP